ncbi:hypothetical protein PIB30_005287 [Stylosanthes scabra]|uniref:RRM domain-containing protein n=1 Tax=Stylosanthes scabra TaxID=79078 RepID=A0ABU6U2W1_9FABA|nr:hypothetical protein [Stylosanthes scabra]
MREGERENQRGDEENREGQWQVVTRGKPKNHWRPGQPDTRHQYLRRQSRHDMVRNEYQQGRRWNERNSYTVFVDNLPANTTKQWLVRVFNSVGRVVDTFLSMKKRAKNPLRFAFVRYATIREAGYAVEQFDGWLIWGIRLTVTESRYRREDSEPNGRSGDGGNANDIMERQRSYKDVLETGRKGVEMVEMNKENEMQTVGNSKIYLQSNNDMLEKLDRAIVGDTLNPYDFTALKETVMKDWHTIEEVKMLGSMKLLMIFDSIQNIEEALNSCFLLNHFLEVRRWTRHEANWSRRC